MHEGYNARGEAAEPVVQLGRGQNVCDELLASLAVDTLDLGSQLAHVVEGTRTVQVRVDPLLRQIRMDQFVLRLHGTPVPEVQTHVLMTSS